MADVLLPNRRRGFSLLELLAAITIMGVLAIVVVPRISGGASVAKAGSCDVNIEIIEVQCALWRREKGGWPSAALSAIGADTNYFPEGLPVCPVDGTAYRIDDSTGKVLSHGH